MRSGEGQKNLRKTAKRCVLALVVMLSVCLCIAGCAQKNENADSSTQATADSSTTATDETPFEAHGALHVDGTNIVDEHGDVFQIRGVSTHGLAWYPQYVNEDAFTTWRDWGANTVRLALYTEESGGYCNSDDASREQLYDTLCAGVDDATQAGMYAIVDWHILSDGNPQTNESDAKALLSQVSAHYAGQDNVIYEICNEPNGNVTWDDVRSYAETIIPIIRANSPNAIIIVGTTTWSQDVDEVAANPIDADNVVYALHFYAATHGQSLRDKAQKAIDAGTPLLVSEFGICDASGNGEVDEDAANTWIDFLDSNGIGYVCWNLSNKNEASALLASTSTATSGWADSDLSAEGLWYKSILQNHAGLSTGTQSTASSGTQSTVSTSSSSTVSGVLASGLIASCKEVNSWESNGKQYAQFSLTVENTSGVEVSDWSAQVDFASTVASEDGWCAGYALDATGTELTIDPESYLDPLAAGKTDSSIGFIVSGSQMPQVVSLH